jgi:hypothetical protein
MKTKNNDQSCSVTGPLLECVIGQDKASKAINFPAPSVSSEPLPQPDMYQDPGNGYNANFTFPQE